MKKIFLNARTKEELRGIATALNIENIAKANTTKLMNLLNIYSYNQLVKALPV